MKRHGKEISWSNNVVIMEKSKDEYTFDFAELSPEYSEHELEMQLYLTALDEQVKLPDENPSIGITIFKSKDKTFVEYALKQSNVNNDNSLVKRLYEKICKER